MARNEEKARGSLNRWTLASRSGGLLPHRGGERRPQLASDCTSLPECEKWRRQLVDDLNRKILAMSSLTLDNRDKIMDLNEDCNKILRILEHWERQIRALGGADYRTTGPKALGAQAVGGDRPNYVYFGISRNLPEVKELLARRSESLAKNAVESIARQKLDPNKLDHEYFGLNDDDLVTKEALVEAKARQQAVDEFLPPKRAKGETGGEDDDEGEPVHWDETWAVPDKGAVDAALLELRKRQVLEKYGV